MEKVLQSEILNTYDSVIRKLVAKYVRNFPYLASYKDDFYQEAVIGVLEQIDTIKEKNSPVVVWFIAKKKINIFVSKVTGLNFVDSRRPVGDRSKVVQLNPDDPTHDGIVPPEDLETKDAFEKLKTLGMQILGGKEFNSVFNYVEYPDKIESEADRQASKRQKANRFNAINNLRTYVQENWK